MSTKGGKVGQNTSPRGDRTETGLRTKPSAEQLQPGAYSDLYRTCRLRITGKHLAVLDVFVFMFVRARVRVCMFLAFSSCLVRA